MVTTRPRLGLEDTLRDIARHEVLHALMATTHDFPVRAVTYHPRPETVVCWPFQPGDFYQHYKANPHLALQVLKQMISVVTCPWVFQREPPTGGDALQLQEWRRFWDIYRSRTTPAGACWERLLLDASDHVRSWFWQPGRAKAVENLAAALLQHGTVDGAEWKKLVRQYAPECLPERKSYAQCD